MLTWRVTASKGLDTAWVSLSRSKLAARGRAVGTDPGPYWLEYELETEDDYITRSLEVKVESAEGARRLELRRNARGWRANGGSIPELNGALDCDLGLCPLTNTMPILRHDLHRQPGRHVFLMAWVAVPELTVHPSRQTYTHLAATTNGAQVRYESGDFSSDLTVDRDGLVVEYPQLASRIAG